MGRQGDDRVGGDDPPLGETTFQKKFHSISACVRLGLRIWRYQKTYFNSVEGVEGMHSAHTRTAKELDTQTVNTTVHAILTTEFALPIGRDASAFKSDKFAKKIVAFGGPNKERIVLMFE